MKYEEPMDLGKLADVKRKPRNGLYENPHVIEKVVDRLMMEFEDDDVTELNEWANGWCEL